MRITLNNGQTLEGTPEEINRYVNMIEYAVKGKYGNEVFYKSNSKGLITIKSMNEEHMKNALCKIMAEEIEELKKLSAEKFVEKVLNGFNDPTYQVMMRELRTRVGYKLQY